MRRFTSVSSLAWSRAFIITASLVLTVANPSATLAQDDASRAAAVEAYIDGVNRGDPAAAAAMFTDDAVHIRPPFAGSCSRQSPCIGRPAILAGLQARLGEHLCITILDLTVNGSVVTVHQEVRNDTIRGRGIERLIVQTMASVPADRILALYAVSDVADPQTAANTAIAQGTQAPGTPLDNPPCV